MRRRDAAGPPKAPRRGERCQRDGAENCEVEHSRKRVSTTNDGDKIGGGHDEDTMS